jgi:low affinity Fe/Cu permease
MGDREHYLQALAIRLSNRIGKPSAIIVAMAFLLAWTLAAIFIAVPLTGHLIVNVAVSMITLLMVIFLQNAHKQDVRALQARIEELVVERQAGGRSTLPDMLTDTELQQIRDLLQGSGDTDPHRRANRDKRPSLF